MNASDEAFFIDALSNELSNKVTQDLTADNLEDDLKPRDNGLSQITNALDVTAKAAASGGVAAPETTSERPQEQSALSEVMILRAIGEHRVSDTCKLGVLNEHPEALKTISSDQCLTTSAFLEPALHVVLAEVRPLMMAQLAVRLSTIPLRLVAEVLPMEHILSPYEGPGTSEQQKLAETVRYKLDRALPCFPWQGARNHYGRAQYLMTLLGEAIRVLAAPIESFAEALRLDTAAVHASDCVARAILDLTKMS